MTQQTPSSELEEVIARTTIVFPQHISPAEAEKLLKFIARTLPGRVDYVVETQKIVEGRTRWFSPRHIPLTTEQYILKIAGCIQDDEGHESTSFSCKKNLRTDVKILGIEFSTIPGYAIKEHRQSQVQLWDRVRTIVDDYFKEKK